MMQAPKDDRRIKYINLFLLCHENPQIIIALGGLAVGAIRGLASAAVSKLDKIGEELTASNGALTYVV